MNSYRRLSWFRLSPSRWFLAGFVGAVAVYMSSASGLMRGKAPTGAVCFSSSNLLKPSDLTYLGAMRMPAGTDTGFSYGSIAGRKVNGELHLFVYGNNPTLHDPVYELRDTGSYGTDYRNAPRMSLVADWGDIYQGRRVTYNADGSTSTLQYLVPAGLYWNEQKQLLYWTYFDAYNNIVRPDWGLGATRLDDPSTGAKTSFGPWRTVARDGDGTDGYGASRCAFLSATPDGKMACHGAYFVTTAAPWGPQLYGGVDWPSANTPVGFGVPDLRLGSRYLSYYFMGGKISATDGTFTGPLRSFRRDRSAGYVWHPTVQGIATEIDPARNNGVGSWTNQDGLSGAAWIDLPDKQGVVFAAHFAGGPNANSNVCGTGHTWYRNTGVGTDRCSHGCQAPLDIAGPVSDAAFPALVFYDPADLENVRAGRTTDYTVEPTAILNLDNLGVKTAGINVLGHAKSVTGFYFDPERRLLFVKASSADDTTPGILTALIHVFRIN